MKSFLRRKQAQAIAALVMAIAVLATVVGLVLSTGIGLLRKFAEGGKKRYSWKHIDVLGKPNCFFDLI